MDLLAILTLLAAAVSFVYGFLQKFKADIRADIHNHISRLETRMDKFTIRANKLEEYLDPRVDKLEKRLDSKRIKLEERKFWLATDKKIEDEILEERIKSSKNV